MEISNSENVFEETDKNKPMPFILYGVFVERFCSGGVTGEIEI
jgi:hypothetical protein